MEYYGYPKDYPIEVFMRSIYAKYTNEKEQKYGVLGIKIKLLDNN